MRIIVTQIEIEEAIKEHVLGQLSIKEGQTITILFKNTRGDDGATAEIDISSPQQGQQSAAAASTVANTGVASSSAATVTTEKPVVEQENITDPSKGATVSTANSGTQQAQTPTSSATTATPLTDPTVVEPAEIPKTPPFDADHPVDKADEVKPATKSLFAGHVRPNNQ